MSRILITCCLALGASGCGKPAAEIPATVRGSASFQGRALAGGLVCFTPDRDKGCPGRIASAFVESDGTFRLPEGVSPGWYHVCLAEPPEWYGSEWERAFPAVLRRPDQSGLPRQVKAGTENVFDFPIELRE